MRIHSVQRVINNPTQLSGRGCPYIFYIKLNLSQLYVFCLCSQMDAEPCNFMFFRLMRNTYVLHNNLNTSKNTQPGFHLGAPNKRKVATKIISYKRYGGILFQKVASGYLLHFVQNGSSQTRTKNKLFAQTHTKSENYTARFPFGSTQKNVKF